MALLDVSTPLLNVLVCRSYNIKNPKCHKINSMCACDCLLFRDVIVTLCDCIYYIASRIEFHRNTFYTRLFYYLTKGFRTAVSINGKVKKEKNWIVFFVLNLFERLLWAKVLITTISSLNINILWLKTECEAQNNNEWPYNRRNKGLSKGLAKQLFQTMLK